MPSLATLAAWELGQRDVGVGRLVQLCAVLELSADDLMRRALERSLSPQGAIEIDRLKLARSTSAELAPLKRFVAIAGRHRDRPEASRRRRDVVVLPRRSLRPLAHLADCTEHQLVRALHVVSIDRS